MKLLWIAPWLILGWILLSTSSRAQEPCFVMDDATAAWFDAAPLAPGSRRVKTVIYPGVE